MSEASIIYVSWGGTGRAATVRQAMTRAAEVHKDLLYLAILDDSTFGDIDKSMLELAKDELGWLLDAQLDLTKTQANAEDVAVRVLIRSGDVADQIVDVAHRLGRTEILIGGPVPEHNHEIIAALIRQVEHRTSATVTLLEP